MAAKSKLLQRAWAIWLLAALFILAIPPSGVVNAQSGEPPAGPSAQWALGNSAGGRPIPIYRWGNGSVNKLVVCAIHGGYERNTYELCEEFITAINNDPSVIPSDVTLYLVPVLNPDGLDKGTRVLDARTNDNNVDLNRNWPYSHQPWNIFHGVNMFAGDNALDQPETKSLEAFIRAKDMKAVIFYHSTWGMVFSNNIKASSDLGAALAKATGYKHSHGWSGENGDARDYLATLGIPAYEIELTSWTATEFTQNWAGLQVFLKWQSTALQSVATPQPVVRVYEFTTHYYKGDYGDKYQTNLLHLLNAVSRDGTLIIKDQETVNCIALMGSLSLDIAKYPETGTYPLENFQGISLFGAGACDVCSWMFYVLLSEGFEETPGHVHTQHPKIPDVPYEYSVSILEGSPRQNAWMTNDTGKDVVLKWVHDDERDVIKMWVEPKGTTLVETLVEQPTTEAPRIPVITLPQGEVTIDVGAFINWLLGIGGQPSELPMQPPAVIPEPTPVPELTVTGEGMKLSCDTSRLAPMFFRIPVGRWACEIIREADAAGIDPNLVATHMRTESCGGDNFKSTSIGWGIMQLLPSSFPEYSLDQLSNPDLNIQLGTQYIANGYRASGKSVAAEAAGYNGGPKARSWFMASTDPTSAVYQQKRAEYITFLNGLGYNGAAKATIVETYVKMITSIYADAAAMQYNSPYIDAAVEKGGMCKTAASQLGLSWPIQDGYFVGTSGAVAPGTDPGVVPVEEPATPPDWVVKLATVKIVLPVTNIEVFLDWVIAICFILALVLWGFISLRDVVKVLFAKKARRIIVRRRAIKLWREIALAMIIPFAFVMFGRPAYVVADHPIPPGSLFPERTQTVQVVISNEDAWRKWVAETPGISWDELIASVKASELCFTPEKLGEISDNPEVCERATLVNILAQWPGAYYPEMGPYDPTVPGVLGSQLGDATNEGLWKLMTDPVMREMYPSAMYDLNENGVRDQGDALFIYTQTGGKVGLCSADPQNLVTMGWNDFDPWNNPSDCARYFAAMASGEVGYTSERAKVLSVTLPSSNPVMEVQSVIEEHRLPPAQTIISAASTTPFDVLILWSESMRVKLEGAPEFSAAWHKVNYNLCYVSWAFAGRDCWKEANLTR